MRLSHCIKEPAATNSWCNEVRRGD